MIIGDFDVERAGRIIWPLKTDPPLSVDADAILAQSVAFQRLKTIAAQGHQSLFVGRTFQNFKPSIGLPIKCLKRWYALSFGKLAGALVSVLGSFFIKIHAIISHNTLYVKHIGADDSA